MKHLEAAITSAYLELDVVLKTEEAFVTRQDTSGCTAICAVITPTHVVVGNAGDSRGVMYTSEGPARQLSRDHKPYLDDERKRIEEAGGMVSMQRVDGACLWWWWLWGEGPTINSHEKSISEP